MKLFLFVPLIMTIQISFAHNPLPHFDLEMSSKEYQNYLQDLPAEQMRVKSESSIEKTIAMGTRLLKWVDFLNQSRTPQTRLRLTSSTTRTGIPIESPSRYSPKIIETNLTPILALLPPVMKEIIVEGAAFRDLGNVTDEKFVELARKIDRAYQSAARWKSLSPWRSQYAARKSLDVRGYYYLNKENWTAEKVKLYTTYSSEIQAKLKEYLTGICDNNLSSLTKCQTEFGQAVVNETLDDYYLKYIKTAEANYRSFFDISQKRNDIVWMSSKPNEMIIPFQQPKTAVGEHFLKFNVEDEYQFKQWNLKVEFAANAAAYMVFAPGVVPHVNGLAGNKITMVSNASLEEYEVQWTIRHEFGHVLGLPDCYLEFYDTAQQEFVNYQLDVSDLMCSRAGNMKERIFLELKRVYLN